MTTRKRLLVRPTLLAAFGVLGLLDSQRADADIQRALAPQRHEIDVRIERARDRLIGELGASEIAPTDVRQVAQWYNWPNWGNWYNGWRNW